ncbi:MAG: motility protein A [Planctomycetaceae bacterium]|jgi:chemotaxis protein MotA|nr:motility protein A [Planctomycetaceae bacterium]
MDIATLIGLVLVTVLLIMSVIMGGGTFSSFYDTASVLVVIGGAIAATLISFPLKDFFGIFKVILKVFLNKAENVNKIIEQIVSLAEVARKDGLLALESKLADIDHKFIKLGIQMAVDGSPPEVIEDIMRTELDSSAVRHSQGKLLMDTVGRYAPAYGMIGTLMGLIMMLANMSDPSSIGKGMAVALITTLYGAIVSNAMALPFADKLNLLNKKELTAMEIVIRGIMAIQAGENPRVIRQKLNSFLAPKARPKEDR